MCEKPSSRGIANGSAIYQIRVEGKLDQNWSSWFDGMTVELEREDPPVTSMTGEIPDQAGLRGILIRLWNLNLSLISLERFGKDLAVSDNIGVTRE